MKKLMYTLLGVSCLVRELGIIEGQMTPLRSMATGPIATII